MNTRALQRMPAGGHRHAADVLRPLHVGLDHDGWESTAAPGRCWATCSRGRTLAAPVARAGAAGDANAMPADTPAEQTDIRAPARRNVPRAIRAPISTALPPIQAVRSDSAALHRSSF
jgi:hypothetical protein